MMCFSNEKKRVLDETVWFMHAVDCRGKEANEDLQDTCVGPKSPKHKTHIYIYINKINKYTCMYLHIYIYIYVCIHMYTHVYANKKQIDTIRFLDFFDRYK